MFAFGRPNRSTLISLAGLLIGVAGLVIQWIAEPAKFADADLGIALPPGILFILAAGGLVLLTLRWWWHAVFAVLIAFWIAGVGTLAGQVTPNLTSDNAGTVAGNLVMVAGLVLAFGAGLFSMVTARRARGRSRPAARQD
jgi:hypothetical protein